MKLRLQVTLDFFHLENALFCAEQSIAGGADLLEIGNSLLKNTGLQSVRIFRERFPKIPLVVDLKVMGSDTQEIKSAAEVGGNAITVCGAISPANWLRCVEESKKLGLEIYLDFRELPLSVISRQLKLAEDADYAILNSAAESATIMQEIAFRFQSPIVLEDNGRLENFEKMLPLGVTTATVRYKNLDAQDVKACIDQAKEVLVGMGPQSANGNAKKYSEQILFDKLGQLHPGQICEVCQDRALLLENVHPLHRFTKIAGQATTIKVLPGSQFDIPKLLLDVAPGSIVVIDAGGEKTAVWNYLATIIATKRKLAGAVIHGAVTEVNLVHSKGFPCYVSSLTPVPGNENATGSPLLDVPLRIGQVNIRPGDWLIGDDSGIICVPADRIFHIVDHALHFVQQREKLLQQIEKTDNIDAIKELIENYQKISPEIGE